MRCTPRFLATVAAALGLLAPPASRAEDAFSFAVLPDTQQETSGTRFKDRLQWILNNRAALNFKFMLHSGDMMNFNLDSQYAFMSEGLKTLDNASFPYATCLGNHDTAAVREDSGSAAPGNVNTNLRNTAKYNAYFPTTRFRNLAGTYEAGKIDNAYHTFSAGGLNWLVLNLELWARTGAVNWAKTVVANHPNHNVIILTHAHLNSDSTIQQNNGGYGDNSPQYIFDNLIKQYANVRLVFCGHVGSHGFRTDTGVKGNPIYQFLQCYHDNTTNPTRIVEINTATGTLKTRVYCPSIGQDKNDGSARTITGIPWVPAASTPAPPAAPTNLKATAVSSSQINLTWTDNAANETGYKVERKTGSGGTWGQVATTGAGATSWSNTGLSASTLYAYRVRATNAGGDSGYSNEASATTPAPPPPVGNGTGLRGEYCDNANFTGASMVRTDGTVNFDWGSGSPDAALGADSFSVRWSGAVLPQYTQTYTFYTTTDDGVRLWVDGKLLIDRWADQSPTEASATIALTAGKKVDLRMDYYENGGGAVAKLAWSCPSRGKEIIPQSQLFPWSGRDVGSVGVAGSDSQSGTAFTVKGSGSDIWNTEDGFHYVYQMLTGDGEIQARVASVENTNAWAKAGVMVRESLAANARHAMAVMTPGYGYAFQRRVETGGTSTTTGYGGVSAPYWVRLVRQGNNFSAYRSADGNAWKWVGTQAMAMGTPAYLGLAVTSHNNGVGCTAQIDNVSTSTSRAPAGALVAVTYVSTVKPYSLATAKAGALPYIDRSYGITALPPALNGGVLVRTANDDKAVTTSSHLTLRLGKTATVYVVYDKKGTLPGWLATGWTLLGETVTTTDAGPSPMRVFRKSVEAGDLVLGGNLQAPASGSLDNYFLVVQGATGKAEAAGTDAALLAADVFQEGPIPADGWQHEGDTDGDGLTDDFEPAHALDPAKPDTDGDGRMDEGSIGPDGRTLWEVQAGVDLGAAGDGGTAGDDGGGSRCGSIGLDLMAPLALLALARRRRRRQ
mgnify:CR=1 FL=1